MKKYFLPLIAIALMVVSSCGDDEIKPNQKPSKNDQELVPSSQKQKMQDVGMKALGYVSALDFTYWRNLADHVNDSYIDNEDYETEDVEDFFEDLVESIKIGGHTEKEEYYWDTYIYSYTDYKKLIMLNKIHAHFTAGRYGWEKESGQHNDLQFTFNDQNGKKCVAKMTTSGKTQVIHIVNLEDWEDYESYYDYSNNHYYDTEYIDNNKYYVEVPEQINITFTVDGQKRINVSIKLDINGIENEVIDLSKLRFNASADVTIDKYEFKTTNIKYEVNNTISTEYKFIKDGKTVVTLDFSAKDFKVDGIGGDITEEDTWDYIEDEVQVSDGNASISIDILGELQVKATVKDFGRIRDIIEKLDDDEESENKFKRDVDELNKLVDANLYYDGTSTKQASFKFMAFEEEDWDDERYWEMHPIISFSDGSSYSLFEETIFFNEHDFKNLIDKAKQIFEDFEDLIED